MIDYDRLNEGMSKVSERIDAIQGTIDVLEATRDELVAELGILEDEISSEGATQ